MLKQSFFLATLGRVSLLVLLAGFGQSRAADGVYKWVDKDGSVHYSDMPPAKVNATKLRNVAPPAAAPAAPGGDAGPVTYVDQEVEFRKRRGAADEAAKQQKEKQQQADQKARACAESRGRMATLQQGGRVYRSNEKGERVYFDDKMFADELAKEKKYQDQNCKA